MGLYRTHHRIGEIGHEVICEMKKLILLFFSVAICVSAGAQTIPSKLLRGIDVTTDEFTKEETYSIKNCCLSINKTGDSTTLFISLACSSFDAPIGLKKIYVLSNNTTTLIERDSNFTTKEVPTRSMTTPASGKFGTSFYKPATFGTRINYVDVWKTNAEPYLGVIRSIINHTGKVKFDGDNNDIIMEFTTKDAAKMEKIFNLYRYMSNNE